MIRPLKLIFTSKPYDKKTNKYGENNTYGVENLRGERLDLGNNTNIGLGIVATDEFWKKFLSHPITAFGYDIEFKNEIPNLPNPKFSKHDIIRALDFWIEHWVYQNQVESVLTGTVNVDHEITLKELILVREKIMKMPVDTKFVRQKIRSSDSRVLLENKFKTRLYKLNNQNVEFTENVVSDTSNTSVSTVDQFCYKVVTMKYSDYIKRFGKTELYSKDMTQSIINPFNQAVNSALNELAIQLSNTAITQAPIATWNLPRNIRIGDLVAWDNELRRFRVANDDDSPQETIRLSTETQSPEFLRWVTTGTFVIPEDTHLIAGNMLDIRNGFRDIVVAHGTVAEELHPGDVVALVNNNEWRKVVTMGADFPAAIPDVSITVNRNIGRDSNGDFVHIGEPTTTATINGVEVQVSDVRLDTEPAHPSLPGFEVMSVPAEVRGFTIDDTTVEEEEEWDPEIDGTPMN